MMHKVLLLLAMSSSYVACYYTSRNVNYMSLQMAEAERIHAHPDLPHLIQNLGLKTLYAKVVEAGLAQTLAANGSLTVLGPTDKAFSNIPDWLKKIIVDKGALSEVLLYHVLGQKLMFNQIQNENSINAINSQPIRFNIYLNNGVVTAQCSPLDKKKSDQLASNGVLHEMGTVMIPPVGDIVNTVSGCPVFTTLVKALQAADLAKVLTNEGPFTVFAPTDKAFAKLDPNVLDLLLKNKTALTEVLLYHVANLTYCSVGLVSYKNLTMLNGQNTKIAVNGGKVKVNSATVMPEGADGSVTNGVVHAIDRVLFPPSFANALKPSIHQSEDSIDIIEMLG